MGEGWRERREMKGGKGEETSEGRKEKEGEWLMGKEGRGRREEIKGEKEVKKGREEGREMEISKEMEGERGTARDGKWKTEMGCTNDSQEIE